jgi:hypothetical protein
VIAEWRDCIECGAEFGLTPKQSHCAVFARMLRCPPCRRFHKRCLAKERALRFRKSVRNADSAPTHAEHTHDALTGASSHV